MQSQSIPKRHLNVNEAASYLAVSAAFLNKARWLGHGPVFLKIGQRVVYDMSDLDAWLASKRRSSTSSGAAPPLTPHSPTATL